MVTKENQIVIKGEKEGYRYMVIGYMVIDRGLCPCAYVGIPLDKYHSKYKTKIELCYQVNCHGGVTFEEYGFNSVFDKGFYWIGWDYAHNGDYLKMPETDIPELEDLNCRFNKTNQKWQPELIAIECVDVIEQLKELER